MSSEVVVNGLTKRYAKTKDSGGVFDVSTRIPAGKFTTLLGESGSGKTTLLRLLAGFLRPDHGSITMGGNEVASDQQFVPTQARDLAMVFQNYALWPHMTVFDNVAFGLKARGVPKSEIRDRVHKTLTEVGLEAFDHRKPAQLSGGQQQRVALARSLVLEPSLLLLDEPLSNLDADLRVQMRNQLKTLQARTGITFVYVTHDQEEAFALSDHMIVLDQGRILQQGTSTEIYARPRNSKVADFMGRRGLHLDGWIESDGRTFTTVGSGGDPMGTFPHLDAGLTNGGPARLVVRSEDLLLCRPSQVPSGHVSVPATVESVSFAGRENQVVVSTAAERMTTAYTSVGEDWAPGDQPHLAFSRDTAWVFRHESAAASNNTIHSRPGSPTAPATATTSA